MIGMQWFSSCLVFLIARRVGFPQNRRRGVAQVERDARCDRGCGPWETLARDPGG